MSLQSACVSSALKGTLPSPWSWLSVAQFAGTRSVNGQSAFVWTASLADVYLELGVATAEPSTPLFFNSMVPTSGGVNNITFLEYDAYKCVSVNSTLFDVPKACGGSGMQGQASAAAPVLPRQFQAAVKVDALCCVVCNVLRGVCDLSVVICVL